MYKRNFHVIYLLVIYLLVIYPKVIYFLNFDGITCTN